ncbi:MAG: hypothetical protein H8E87_07300 [FCB group bacterium]|nr:hypothetical protein [FCB group bacterium]
MMNKPIPQKECFALQKHIEILAGHIRLRRARPAGTWIYFSFPRSGVGMPNTLNPKP